MLPVMVGRVSLVVEQTFILLYDLAPFGVGAQGDPLHRDHF
jgi:hypothetical protein